MNKKAKIILFSVVAIAVVFVAVILFPKLATSAKLTSMNPSERIEAAQANYPTFQKNPEKTSECLISVKAMDKETLLALVPQDCEILYVAHDFTHDGLTVSGGFTECAGKTFEQIYSEYFNEIYDMTKSAADSIDNELAQYANDFENGTMAQEDYEMVRNDLIKRKAHHLAQLESMDNGIFNITGIRLKAKNADLYEISTSDNVYAVELLKSYSKVTPITAEQIEREEKGE